MHTRTLFATMACLGLIAGSAAAQPSYVINEIYYDSPGTDVGCFTEILGPAGADLTGWSLVGVNGSDGLVYREIFLDGMVIPADGRLVIAQDATVLNYDYINTGVDWQNGPDEVELHRFGDYIDGICYGEAVLLSCEGGTWGPDVISGMSISRCPDGFDSDNNADDTEETAPTPGETNACTAPPLPTELTLCEAVALDGEGMAIHVGELVHITSSVIVLNDHGTFTATSLDCGATDGDCCVNLFDFNYTTPVNSGDELDVIGTVTFYNGKVEIGGPGLVITVLSTGNPLPAPENISTEELAINGNQYESCLIMIDHLMITGGDPWPPEGLNANVEVTDESGVPVILRVDKETNIDGSPEPEQPFTCIGLGGQFDNLAPYTEGFQITPRSLDDIYYDPSPVHEASWGGVKNLFR
jgi:hypothetical protein